jgi:putative endonuclease
LAYFERYSDIRNAIDREKQIKGWLRIKKLELIVTMNPEWCDLSEEWGKPIAPHSKSIDPSLRSG